MPLIIPETNKDYVLVVNKAEFYDAALELGYDSVILLTKDMPSEKDILTIKEAGKFMMLYICTENQDDSRRTQNWIKAFRDAQTKKHLLQALDQVDYEDEGLPLSELARKSLMPPDRMESYLKENGYIPSDDYNCRCGNCHRILLPDAKYCSYCGTKRGEGKFLPYMNNQDVLYGCPTKIKKKCNKCGYTWIEYEFNKGANIKYCPKCGESKPITDEIRDTDFITSYFLSGGAQYDSDSRPKLLTEQQVITILNERSTDRDPVYSRKDMMQLLEMIGFPIDVNISNTDIPLTEVEADTLNHIREIWRSEGEDLYGYPGVVCPHCGSKLVAGIGRYNGKETVYPASNTKNPLRNGQHTGILTLDCEPKPTYLCLCCSEEFF